MNGSERDQERRIDAMAARITMAVQAAVRASGRPQRRPTQQRRPVPAATGPRGLWIDVNGKRVSGQEIVNRNRERAYAEMMSGHLPAYGLTRMRGMIQ